MSHAPNTETFLKTLHKMARRKIIAVLHGKIISPYKNSRLINIAAEIAALSAYNIRHIEISLRLVPSRKIIPLGISPTLTNPSLS